MDPQGWLFALVWLCQGGLLGLPLYLWEVLKKIRDSYGGFVTMDDHTTFIYVFDHVCVY